MRVLVIEDDTKLGPLLQRGLNDRGGAADLAATGEDALWMAQAHRYDAIVLDLMLLGLDSGADDYLTKPFSVAELRARLRAIVRRAPSERPSVLEVGDLRLDPATHEAWRGEVELQLAAKEFALLELFMRRPGEVLSRYELLENAWDMAYDNRSNVVTVHIRRLREKVDRPFGRDSIETLRGAG